MDELFDIIEETKLHFKAFFKISPPETKKQCMHNRAINRYKIRNHSKFSQWLLKSNWLKMDWSVISCSAIMIFWSFSFFSCFHYMYIGEIAYRVPPSEVKIWFKSDDKDHLGIYSNAKFEYSFWVISLNSGTFIHWVVKKGWYILGQLRSCFELICPIHWSWP